MWFIDCEREFEVLCKVRERSRKKFYILVIYGLRRVGKMWFLREFLGEKDIYFFVNWEKGSIGLFREYENIFWEKGVIMKRERIESWDDFFEVFFERFEGVVVFDEF